MLKVSSRQLADGEIVAMIQVFVFPPKESRKSLVSLLSLYEAKEDDPNQNERRSSFYMLQNMYPLAHTCKECELNAQPMHI